MSIGHTAGEAPGGFDPATQPKQPDKSLGELFGDLTTEMSDLVRKELELAKVEARDELGRAGRAAGMFGAAGVGSLLALTLLSMALAWLLDQAMNRALAFAIVGVVWAIVAAVLVARAKREIKGLQALPTTRQTLQEDVQWAQAQKS